MLSSIVSPLDGFRSPFGPQRGFNPARLFGPADTGWLYDLSDMSTLFQDAAGTTPVTAVDQPVGLQLDKSKGLVLGPELVTNGDFSNGTTGWLLGTGVTVSGGSASFSSAGSTALLQSLNGISTTPGVSYEIRFDVTRVSGSISCRLASTGTTPITVSASGSYRFVERVGSAAPTNRNLVFDGNSFTGTIDNISVRELPGNHRSQSVSLNRPTYGRHPLGGIRNLLTFTEEFDNAVWAKSQVNVTPNVATDPLGSLADKVIPTTTSGGKSWTCNPGFTSSGAWTFSRMVKADGYGFYAIALNNANAAWYNLSTGAITSVGANVTATSAVSLGGGWWRVSLTTTQAIGFIQEYVGNAANFNAFTGDGVSGILVGGSQWEAGSTATPYQRVGSAFDVTEAGVPDLYYLSYDGLNDSLSTAPFAWGSDKATVVAGVRKLSDAAGDRVIVEASANSDSTNGTFRLGTNAATFTWRSRGTVSAATSGAGAQPISAVLTGMGDISGDVARLRRTGVQVGEVLTDQGTGNFGTHAAFFGARAGTGLFFNGWEYSNVGISRLLTTGELAALESWTAGKAGNTL